MVVNTWVKECKLSFKNLLSRESARSSNGMKNVPSTLTLVFINASVLRGWYSAKRAGVKRACPNKAMAHAWFMHDAHLGCAFLLLKMLAEYALLSMTVMVTPCLWYVVGMKLVCPMSSFLTPVLHAPLLANADKAWKARSTSLRRYSLQSIRLSTTTAQMLETDVESANLHAILLERPDTVLGVGNSRQQDQMQ